MRRFRILALLVITLAMLGTATVCWAVDLTSGNRIDEGVWYKPTYLPSVDAAIGALRNLGGRKAFCAWACPSGTASAMTVSSVLTRKPCTAWRT